MERMRVEAGEAIKADEEAGAAAMMVSYTQICGPSYFPQVDKGKGLMEKLNWVQKLHQDLALTEHEQ